MIARRKRARTLTYALVCAIAEKHDAVENGNDSIFTPANICETYYAGCKCSMATIEDVRSRLSRMKKILIDELHLPCVLMNQRYVDEGMPEVKGLEEAAQYVASGGGPYPAAAIRLLNGGQDFFFEAAQRNILNRGAGMVSKNLERIDNAVYAGQILSDRARRIIRQTKHNAQLLETKGGLKKQLEWQPKVKDIRKKTRK